MYKSSFRITTLGLLGVVIFLFVGCSTISKTSKSTSSSPSYSFDDSELLDQLQQIDTEIEQSPDNLTLYKNKGELLYEAAQQEDPAERTPIYEEIYATSQKAKKKSEESDNQQTVDEINEFLSKIWCSEYNAGIEITQAEEISNPAQLDQAIAHFHNATIILPDTAASYRLKAETEYKKGTTDQAIKTLEKAHEKISEPSSEIIEQLAFLYQETDQPSKAISMYEQAETISEGNLNVLHGLANSYISAENHPKAIDVLNILTDHEPENIVYNKIRGTQFYFLGAQKIKTLNQDTLSQDKQTDLFIQADSLWQQADNDFQQALSENQSNKEWNKELSGFYQNMSASYQESLDYLNDKEAQQARKGITRFLEASIPLYVDLVEQYPDNQQYWKNLYQAYLYLDMKQEAEEIKENVTQS